MEGGCVGREAVRGVAPLAVDLAVPLDAGLDRMHRRRGQLLALLAEDDLAGVHVHQSYGLDAVAAEQPRLVRIANEVV